MRLSEVMHVLEDIAPLRLAETWDNVGLLAGDPAVDVTRALFAIDMTAEVLAEARQKSCNLLVAYHPPLFAPLKRVTSDSLIFKAISDRIAIYAPHTALDSAKGGTNDVLGDLVGMGEARAALRAPPAKDAGHKLVAFVPENDFQKVANALFEAGAGRIGDYSACSFRSLGKGTFFGEAGTNPAVGKSGHREDVPELRLETVVRVEDATRVVAALRASHPYEEPAFDLVRLGAHPESKHLGIGRVGDVAPVARTALVDKIKKGLGVDHVLVAGSLEGNATRVAVTAGSCGDLYEDAVAAGAEVYVTGEMRHHDALAASRKMTVVCALHSNSERAAMKIFAANVKARAPSIDVAFSERDRDPFRIT
ncbi:MAG: Nif3-like dinuclear metal center hexameric protein [Polyangiaceae bacterium]